MSVTAAIVGFIAHLSSRTWKSSYVSILDIYSFLFSICSIRIRSSRGEEASQQPPGKLGIVIDTTLEGPTVLKVNSQGPLAGTLFPGDIIVAINDVDTRAMSAAAITALMVLTSQSQRKLTFLCGSSLILGHRTSLGEAND